MRRGTGCDLIRQRSTTGLVRFLGILKKYVIVTRVETISHVENELSVEYFFIYTIGIWAICIRSH